MTNKTFVKIQAYELFTPKFLGDSFAMERYDHEQIEYLLQCICNIPLRERAFHIGKSGEYKVINLVDIRHSEDQDFMEGTFSCARYGQLEEIINVHEQIKTGEKPRDHGLKNEVPFILDKRNGLMLLHKDKNNVVSREMIYKYFRYHINEIDLYCEKFNSVNPIAKIFKRSFVKVGAVPSQDFFEEIKKFALIKEAFVIKNIEDAEQINNEGIAFLTREATENNVEDFQEMKVSYKNTVKKRGIKHITAFFEKLYEADKYDKYGVSGQLESGKPKTITMAKFPQTYDIKVSINENGIISLSDLINEMIAIAKYQNPVIDKNEGVQPIEKVGDLLNAKEKQKGSKDEASEPGKEIS
ncbi:hypothetical protein [Priestia megaterium]